ncbi:ABC transporter ATP-binding protein, partial [Marinomonas arenicola]|uniref:alpha/beta fold hydrolase n=1 Tax=Marinomonas arenicola TaxID=569601 RepID=UPI0031262A61
PQDIRLDVGLSVLEVVLLGQLDALSLKLGNRYFKEAYQLAARINPNIQVIVVEGGHCFMQQYPEQSAKKVREILKQEINPRT